MSKANRTSRANVDSAHLQLPPTLRHLLHQHHSYRTTSTPITSPLLLWYPLTWPLPSAFEVLRHAALNTF